MRELKGRAPLFSPVAIIGRSCILPEAHSPEQLWDLVRNRRVAISPAPSPRWRVPVRRALETGLCVTDAGGFVRGVPAAEGIDAGLDPLFHWLFHTGRMALDDAGLKTIPPGVRMGAIVGNLAYPTESLVDLAESVYVPSAGAKKTSLLNRFSAGFPVHLLCRELGLTAGGYALDAACASSLYAIKIACDWLQAGRADVMLAGGVNRVEGLLIHAGFTALRALSPSGLSRPFHRDADGLVPAEGAGLIVLKLLSAVQPGDRILAVIRGVGLSNDGRSGGLLAPSAVGQARAMRLAYAQSGLSPADISLIECHATGTPVGDSVELQSMSQVFAGLRHIPIGSLKSNLGHSLTVAGVAGVLKILEAMRHRIRPATVNAAPASEALEGSAFRLLCDEEEWPAGDGEPRRAAVNAFGFGGNNAHILLEEFVPSVKHASGPVATRRRAAVVGISARIGGGRCTEDFENDLIAPHSRVRRLDDGTLGAFAEEAALPATGLVFPPLDLGRALAQQTLLLEAATELIGEARDLHPERTGVFIGMSCDAEGTRTPLSAVYGFAEGASDDSGVLKIRMDTGFDGPRTIGCMPNMLANRVSRQFDLGGPGFTVSAEELSGVRALELAVDALNRGEIDAAVVGASDLGVEPVHRAACAALPGDGDKIPGDGACLLLLKREEDAFQGRDPIRAFVDLTDGETGDRSREIGARVRECFGHVHAASGLLETTAAIVALERRASFVPAGRTVPLLAGPGSGSVRIESSAIGGQTLAVTITSPPSVDAGRSPIPTPEILTFAADDVGGLIQAIASNRPCTDESAAANCRLAIVAFEEERPARIRQALSFLHGIRDGARSGHPAEGVFFSAEAMAGEMAFVFTGAAAAYRDMGRELLLAFPWLAPKGRHCEWIYNEEPGVGPSEFERLCGSSLLCQSHSVFTQQVLGLRPRAAIGLSSGETNSLFALGAWRDMDDLLRDIESCGLYTEVLGGKSAAVHAAWKGAGISGDEWAGFWIPAPLEDVKEAIVDEPSVHITIVNSPDDVVIGGEAEACRRVAGRFGGRITPIGADLAVHAQEVKPAADLWRRLHHRPTVQPPGIRFYSNAHGGPYELTDDSVAEALTAQAVTMIDFPRTILRAWDDGVRIFVEHGPRGQCAQSIRRILGQRPFVALSMDSATRSSLMQAIFAAAELWTAGVSVDLANLRRSLGRRSRSEGVKFLRFPAHPPAPDVMVMSPAPLLAPVVAADVDAALPVAAEPADHTAAVEAQAVVPVTGRTTDAGAAALHRQISAAHLEHFAQMERIESAFRETQLRLIKALTNGKPAPLPAPERTFSRQQLLIHASGRISEIFGPEFREQDGFPRQVRMPEPPLLLADRVCSLSGEPGSMGAGTIVTETDIPADAWYLHQGRMPAGVTIESGQADLMLISWLGVDKLNRGARVYRLLGCEIAFSVGLPRVGETLRYRIAVDRHAAHAGVRLFFFHYDCTTNGVRRLTVRNGQAGFFTDAELAGSEGVLWSAEKAFFTPDAEATLDRAPCVTTLRSFGPDRLRAFAEGRLADCFGAGFEIAWAHTRTARTQGAQMQLLQSISAFDPAGGPVKRGYLKAHWAVSPDDWFFRGHFRNDPCMPGTLMFEGCLQAMAFYISGLGLTLERDGWRFEPVPDVFYTMRCRGQVIPASRQLTYEVFVDELMVGPEPVLFADVLCTVDGLKAFHCKRLGLRIVPDWPLDETQPLPSANMPFDYQALLACALGRPSHAFGPAFERFDRAIRTPRLPGPPYHFLSRIARADKSAGPVGASAEAEYDVPSDAWYFRENEYPVMPISVLLEVLLQPCGWLASWAGTWQDISNDVHFRNLDGDGTFHSEVGPAVGSLRTRAVMTACSQLGAMTVTAFRITCRAGERAVFDGTAVFGHFPPDALQNQVGLPVNDAERKLYDAPGTEGPTLDSIPENWRPGRDKLRMVQRITGYWRDGGSAQLGQIRAEFDVDPRQWFFKAHFFGDPVQPGSLGIETIAQTLQLLIALRDGCGKNGVRGRFEPIASGRQMKWTFRGQVIPRNRKVTVLLEVLESTSDLTRASASLWVDGKKIYSVPAIAMRMADVAEDPAPDGIEELDPVRDTWLMGHCPTFTIPALPMMSMVDRLATAAARTGEPGDRVVEIRDVALNGWIGFPSGKRRLKTEVISVSGGARKVSLSVWREASRAELSRFDPIATAVVQLDSEYPAAWAPIGPLDEPPVVPIPYDCGELFHGPSFHMVRELRRSERGSIAWLDAKQGSVPPGLLDQGLLDGILHAIPNEHLCRWSDRISPDEVGFPSRILRFTFFAQPPADRVCHCMVLFSGFHSGDRRFPRFRVQASAGGRLWVDFDLVYVLFPKGPLGRVPNDLRRKFFAGVEYVPGMELGCFAEGRMRVSASDLVQSDWLPGTVNAAFRLRTKERLQELAAKQLVARELQIHPAQIAVAPDGESASTASLPLNRFLLRTNRTGDEVDVSLRSVTPLDCDPLRQFWNGFCGIAAWPVADLHMGLAERFVRRVELTDPDGFSAIRGRPSLYFANHQVAVESVLFSVAIGALSGLPVTAIAKAEHRHSWIGRLIGFADSYPGVRKTSTVLHFDRSHPEALLTALDTYGKMLDAFPASLLIHVEGTRAFSCRTPVSRISSVLPDLAVRLDLPVVPVRFIGALPATPVKERLEFPFGGGQMDIRIGSPIPPGRLREMSLVERNELILDSINSLAPPDEVSFGRIHSPGSVGATLEDALRNTTRRCANSDLLLEALDGKPVEWPDGDVGKWLQDFAEWLASTQ